MCVTDVRGLTPEMLQSLKNDGVSNEVIGKEYGASSERIGRLVKKYNIVYKKKSFPLPTQKHCEPIKKAAITKPVAASTKPVVKKVLTPPVAYEPPVNPRLAALRAHEAMERKIGRKIPFEHGTTDERTWTPSACSLINIY